MGAKRVCDSSGLFPEAIVIHALCRNSIIVLFTLSVPNSHVIFLVYISTSSYIVSGLIIMPPTSWGGAEERGAERQEVQGGKKVNTLSVGGAGQGGVYRACHTNSPASRPCTLENQKRGKNYPTDKRAPLGNISDK